MAHIYKETVWQSPTGRWHSGDVEELGKGSGKWWIPCRILDIAPVDFIYLLKDTFNASNFSYKKETNVLLYSWEKEEDAKRYRKYINDKAKLKKVVICG